MKKTITLTLAGLMLATSIQFVNPSIEAIAAPKRTKAEQTALDVALKDAGITEKEASHIKIKYELEDGVYVYDIDFYVTGGEYSYDINAENGKIVSKDFEKKRVPKKKITRTKKNSGFISKNKAKSIVLKHAKLSEKEVEFVKVKKERENRSYVYDIEFHTDTKEYSYEVNAKTGKIIEFSSEPLDNDWDD